MIYEIVSDNMLVSTFEVRGSDSSEIDGIFPNVKALSATPPRGTKLGVISRLVKKPLP
jgi:hypothetical protein